MVILKDLMDSDLKIVLDTNIYLDIYRSSSEYAEFCLNCLEKIKEMIVVTSTIDIEFNKHNKTLFNGIQNKYVNLRLEAHSHLEKAWNNISKIFFDLEKNRYCGSDNFYCEMEGLFDEARMLLDNLFDENKVKAQLDGYFSKVDHVMDMFNTIKQTMKMVEFSYKELYQLSQEAEKRFKNETPPGFKDNKKIGLSKYGDFLIWNEIMKYAKDNHTNILFVTNDKKSDWWENEKFHNELINEFEKRTKHKIYGLTGNEFIAQISEYYEVPQRTAHGIILENTANEYVDSIYNVAFSLKEMDIINGRYADNIPNVGDMGIEELEDLEYNFISGKLENYYNEKAIYHLYYKVKANGISTRYWGRDEDTHETILSPGIFHEFSGDIILEVTRDIDEAKEIKSESNISGVEIFEINLREVSYIDYMEEDYLADIRNGYDEMYY